MELTLDEHGHLANKDQWSRDWAELMATQDNLVLNTDHWKVIEAVQQIYQITEDTPPMRLLIKLLRKQLDPSIESRFLYRLFPENPVRQASKYAGLPKPKHCM